MRGKVVRLVSLVNLVVFLISNTAGAALPQLLHDSRACRTFGCCQRLMAGSRVLESSAPETSSSGCEHCASKQECPFSEPDQEVCPNCGGSVAEGTCECPP